MITFECPSCGTKLKSPDDAAGKKAKCKQCGNVSQVPIPLIIKPREEPRRESPIVEVDYARAPVPPPIQKNELVAIPQQIQPPVPEVLHCIGCNQIVRHEVACRRCGKVFCSELCLERHEERCGPKKKVRKERDYEPPTIIVNANSSAVASASAKAISGGGQKLLGCIALFILVCSCCLWSGVMSSKTASTAPDQPPPKRAVEIPADPPIVVADVQPEKEPPKERKTTKRPAKSSTRQPKFFGENMEAQQKAMRDAQAKAAKEEAEQKRDKAISDKAIKKKAREDARPPALTDEEKADSRLKMARQLLETNVTTGNFRLETLIKDFPGTKAAETAQRILDGKEK